MDSELWTPQQAADYLGFAKDTLRNHRYLGDWPTLEYVHLGQSTPGRERRKVMYLAESVKRFAGLGSAAS